MNELKCHRILRKLNYYKYEVLNFNELLDAPSIRECVITIRRPNGKISHDIRLDGVMKRINRSIIKEEKGHFLKWFDKIETCKGNRFSIVKCKCCNSQFKCRFTELCKGEASCLNCFANELLNESPIEILKDFKPWPTDPRYYVNNRGDVISTIGKIKNLMLENKNGYKCLNTGKKRYGVHRLVLESFGYPRPTKKHIVRHLNDIRHDNRLENLEWGLQKRNMADKKINQIKLEKYIKETYKNGVDLETLSVLTSYSIETLKAIVSSFK